MGVGLNANWIESLLRNESKSVESVWLSTFRSDFTKFLKEGQSRRDESSENSSLSAFDSYVVEDLARTDLRCINLDMKAFGEYCEARRQLRWRRNDAGQDGSAVPEATPFNSAAMFLELFFLRLRTTLKHDVSVRIKTLLEGSPGLPVDPVKRTKLVSLVAAEGTNNSFELIATNVCTFRGVRTLRAEDCGQIVTLLGVVTRCSDVKPELRFGAFECLGCGKLTDTIEQHFRFTEPTNCWEQPCGNRTKWNLRLESCLFADWQKIRVQEISDDQGSTAGAVPRAIDVICRGVATERCKAGDRVRATGTLVAVPDVPTLFSTRELPQKLNAEKNRAVQSEAGVADSAISGLQKLGVRELAYKQVFVAFDVQVADGGGGGESQNDALSDSSDARGRLLRELIQRATPASPTETSESSEFWTLLKHPLLRALGLTYDEHKKFKSIANSLSCTDRLICQLAPEIFGCSDIKKGLLLLLVGGVEKLTKKDNIKLRGDINVCIVGDPGTAKSHFLNFIHVFADRAVLASGKSSTAAGLTASVHKDMEQGESVVEAGALILADLGVCCIDEFDKMDEKDMVSIHEAMEQQTISISKAGIQATMNARASVLAACNPADGRYNVSRPLRENLKMSPTILSRFDLIFVLLDKANEEEDRRIASHILKLPCTGGDPTQQLRGMQLDSLTELKKYIQIAKCFKPRMSREARTVLCKEYVVLRQKDALPGTGRSARMTVRQLESIIRLSEALAKLAFSDIVTQHHAQAAVKLFANSCSRVKPEQITLDDALEGEEMDEPDEYQAIKMDADVFERVQSLIVEHLRELEDKLYVLGSQPNESQAASVRELMGPHAVVNWYMETYLKEIVSAEDVALEKRKAQKILARMEANGVVAMVDRDSSGAHFQVHPNFGEGRQHRAKQSSSFASSLEDSQSSVAASSRTDSQDSSGALHLDDDDFVAYLYGGGTSAVSETTG